MKFLGSFKAGNTIRYSVQFHNDSNTTVDPTSPAARHRKPDNTYANLAAPAKLDGKTGWYGGSINTTGFASGSHEVRISGTVNAHEVGTVVSFQILDNTNKDVYDRVGAPAGASVSADIAVVPTKAEMDAGHALLAIEANVEGHLAVVLTAYDPPTKTEMDAGFAGLNNPTAAQIADAVWDEILADHQSLTTFGGAIRVMQALVKQNIVWDDTTFDVDGNVTSMRIRLFDTAAAATNATDGGSSEGEFMTLTVSGVYTAGKMDMGKVTVI